MSIYTEQKKIKSLWHPITDRDFDIDFSKPIILATDEGSIFLVDGIHEMFDYWNEERLFDFKAQKLTKEGKEQFRDVYFGYMYVDDAFYKAIEWAKGEYIEDVKALKERPYLFVMRSTGPKVFDFFDFETDGALFSEEVRLLSKGFLLEYPEFNNVEYVVNLQHVSETSLNALYVAPAEELKTAYVVTSGEYSDYRVDGVFSNKEKADLFANKVEDRTIEEYNIDDEDQLRQENWYEVNIYIDESSEVKDAYVNDLFQFGKFFDAVRFTVSKGSSNRFSFYLKALNRDKAKAIALERFHALLAVESSHFPMLRWMRDASVWYGTADYQEGLTFGYFDYKAYFCPRNKKERIQDLFMKVKDALPIPLTEEDEGNIDWQHLTEDVCLQLMNSHGLKIELKKDLPVEFI